MSHSIERKLTIDFDYSPYRPGRYSGPPENCYPEEPAEIEITSISVEYEKDGKAVLLDLDRILRDDEIREKIEEMCFIHVADEKQAAEEAKADYLYEKRRDREY